MSETLAWLQEYYLSLCNGDWEHQYGVKIDTLDNPGWSFRFDLSDTEMEDVVFEAVKIERSETDWIHCRVKDNVFEGFCGPLNLSELISLFRTWVLKRTT